MTKLIDWDFKYFLCVYKSMNTLQYYLFISNQLAIINILYALACFPEIEEFFPRGLKLFVVIVKVQNLYIGKNISEIFF